MRKKDPGGTRCPELRKTGKNSAGTEFRGRPGPPALLSAITREILSTKHGHRELQRSICCGWGVGPVPGRGPPPPGVRASRPARAMPPPGPAPVRAMRGLPPRGRAETQDRPRSEGSVHARTSSRNGQKPDRKAKRGAPSSTQGGPPPDCPGPLPICEPCRHRNDVLRVP